MSPEEEEQLFGSVDSDSVADRESSSPVTDDTQASEGTTVQEHLTIDDQPSEESKQSFDVFERSKLQSDVAAIFYSAWDLGRIALPPLPLPSCDTARAAPQLAPSHQSFALVGMPPTMPPYPLATSSHHQLGTPVGRSLAIRSPAPYPLDGHAPSEPHFHPIPSQHHPPQHQHLPHNPMLALQSPRQLPQNPQAQARDPMLVAGHGSFQFTPYGGQMVSAFPRHYAPHSTETSTSILGGALVDDVRITAATPVVPQPSLKSHPAQLPASNHYYPAPAHATGEIYAFVAFTLYTQMSHFLIRQRASQSSHKTASSKSLTRISAHSALPRRALHDGPSGAPSPDGRSAGAPYGRQYTEDRAFTTDTPFEQNTSFEWLFEFTSSRVALSPFGRNNALTLPLYTDAGPQRLNTAPPIPQADPSQASTTAPCLVGPGLPPVSASALDFLPWASTLPEVSVNQERGKKRKAEVAIKRQPPPGQLSIEELVKKAEPAHESQSYDCMVREPCKCPGDPHQNPLCSGHRPHSINGSAAQVQAHLAAKHGFPNKKERDSHKPAVKGGPRTPFPTIPCVWASQNLKTGEQLCTEQIEKDKMAAHIVQYHTRGTWFQCKYCDELCHRRAEYRVHLESCEAYLDPSKKARHASTARKIQPSHNPAPRSRNIRMHGFNQLTAQCCRRAFEVPEVTTSSPEG
ncbi:hypothetical protein C8F04DRAFT_1238916 [Mycena alexandri]|uniref:Uncharacterized protein n=1 Tax=Mycena alexandri TaxID=1745969 RepID=A0AAD6WST0_9AGAR|nr:hypothetical protein C8F04DRAFT_1238916 [Mycena alexandri]